mgnify:CR=1 FL=1
MTISVETAPEAATAACQLLHTLAALHSSRGSEAMSGCSSSTDRTDSTWEKVGTCRRVRQQPYGLSAVGWLPNCQSQDNTNRYK